MRKQIKTIWDSYDWSTCRGWMLWTIVPGLVMFAIDCFNHCLLNQHDYEAFPDGIRCIWCNKPEP